MDIWVVPIFGDGRSCCVSLQGQVLVSTGSGSLAVPVQVDLLGHTVTLFNLLRNSQTKTDFYHLQDP